MISKVGALRRRKEWEKWVRENLPDALPFEGAIPPLDQEVYPAYQLDSVDISACRNELSSLLLESANFPLVVVLAGEPTTLAYQVTAGDINSLLIEAGRRDEFLSLVSVEPPGSLLLEHPREREGSAPFWLSAAGSFEHIIPRFERRVPGGDLYNTHVFAVESR